MAKQNWTRDKRKGEDKKERDEEKKSMEINNTWYNTIITPHLFVCVLVLGISVGGDEPFTVTAFQHDHSRGFDTRLSLRVEEKILWENKMDRNERVWVCMK